MINSRTPTSLPVETILPALKQSFETANAVVLQASPGAGKTTVVPLYLLEEVVRAGQKIIMLEPRRLAARASAARMAEMLGEKVGETVGYRVRLDSKVSKSTRIEVVTEGILTRRMQSDPDLAGIGMVIFDEFHERSLQTDLGLALARQIQEILRDDLEILIMSATLDTGEISTLLGGADVIEAEGRQFPVETRFLSRPAKRRVEFEATSAIETALADCEGDILVFLPGVGEISKTQIQLQKKGFGKDICVIPLYGNLSQQEQDRAIRPDRQGRRKIVLATDIAETSLTIEGVQVVIDAGLARIPRFDPNSGMNRLETRRVSRSSADQRRGRAGRLGPGVCYRLWTAPEDRGLLKRHEPEIASTDLSGLVLELANWGVREIKDLPWMTEPPKGFVSQARDLLRQLGALDPGGQITPLGQEMVKLPLHPRLACMVVRSKGMSLQGLACDLAALLSERDIVSGNGLEPNADIRDRLEKLHHSGHSKTGSSSRSEAGPLRQVIRTRDDLLRRVGGKTGKYDPSQAGILLAFAYPDRIGERRESSDLQYRLSGGRGAQLRIGDKLQAEPYLVVADLDGKGRDAQVRQAIPISFTGIEANFAALISVQRDVFWDEKRQRVLSVEQRKLGALTLETRKLDNPSHEEVATALLTVVQSKNMDCLNWDDDVTSFLDRVQFAHYHETGNKWPDFSKEALQSELEEWLFPYLVGLDSLEGLKGLNLLEILSARLSWEQHSKLDIYAPKSVAVPSGSRIGLDYSNSDIPVLAVRLQELFGLEQVPKVGGGTVDVSVHILSPARRPVQITKDLANFWRNTYPDVKKDLKGRYPKHYWPDNPLEAEATSKIKPRKQRKPK